MSVSDVRYKNCIRGRREEKFSPFSSHELYDPAKIYLFLFQTISGLTSWNVPSLV